MLHPAPLMISAPVKNQDVIVKVDVTEALVYDAAMSVENKQGKKR